MRKEDRPCVDVEEASTPDEDVESSEVTPLQPQSEEDGDQSSAYSAALMVSLTQQKTAALAAEFTQQPRIALAAVVYTLALSQFRLDLDYYRCYSSLQLSIRQANLDGAAGSRAMEQLNAQRQNWLSQFPSTAVELWPWCRAQTQERLLELLAFCAAATVDAVVLPHRESSDAAKVEHANQLAAALQMDMRLWFTPTVENFFGRVSKMQIADALTEAKHPLGPQEVKMKKGELASVAAKAVQDTGWLPEPLRFLD